MPFIETTLFKEDIKKFEEVANIITKNLYQIFKTKKNTITIYNKVIESKNFYHNSVLQNKEKRIFIKIFCLKRNKNLKKKLALNIIYNIKKLIKIKNADNIAIYFFDKIPADIHHGVNK
jgi:hypothetical protein